MITVFTQRRTIQMPDKEIKIDNPKYIYVPLRGWCSILAVFNIKDECIGWMDTMTLGYKDAKSWITETKFIDQGY